MPDDLLAALGIDLGKCFKILVEGGTHGAIGIIVAPLATRGSINLDSAANQFLAEVDELFDPLLEHGELFGVICLDNGFPVFDHAPDLFIELEESVAVLLHDGSLRRHIDAAGFHHDCIDQRIDTLDVERGAARSLDGFYEFRVPAAVVVGQHGDRRGQKREQSENRVQLGCNRKPRRKRVTGGASRFHGFRHRTVSLLGRSVRSATQNHAKFQCIKY